MAFDKNVLDIDAAAETGRIVSFLKESVQKRLRRHGTVVGISGGVDSAVVLALCVEAFGLKKVVAVMMPEKDSSPESETLARALAAQFGVEPVREDITAALEGSGCYRRRDEAIHRVFPEYDAAAGYKAKLMLPQNLLEQDTLNVFLLAIQDPEGREYSKPAPAQEFMQIMAASSFKQRTRMAMLYYHAELNHFAVAGTPNRNEHDQGFFVKYGDSGADVRPIVHLFKTQVYQLAEHLNVPEEIRRRPPTTDTYSAHSTQEEFFFRLPFRTMDLLWYAMDHGIPADEVARVMELSPEQVQRVFNDLTRKARTTAYLRTEPLSLAQALAARG